MFAPMVAGLLALWRPLLGFVAHVALAGGAFWLFGLRGAGGWLIAMPLLLLATLYSYGRPLPLKRARQVLLPCQWSRLSPRGRIRAGVQ
jgi:hypothetical protein